MFVDGTSHYFNIVDGKIIDLTASQFKHPIKYDNYEIVERETILSNQDTNSRYSTLKNLLNHYLEIKYS